jgi:hypothetical protein
MSDQITELTYSYTEIAQDIIDLNSKLADQKNDLNTKLADQKNTVGDIEKKLKTIQLDLSRISLTPPPPPSPPINPDITKSLQKLLQLSNSIKIALRRLIHIQQLTPRPPETETPLISVIIPVTQEIKYEKYPEKKIDILSYILELTSLDINPAIFEIILVMNYYDDNVLPFELVDHVNIIFTKDENTVLSFSQYANIGVEKARGEYLLFLAQDLVVPEEDKTLFGGESKNWADFFTSKFGSTYGIIGAKILTTNNKIYSNGIDFAKQDIPKDFKSLIEDYGPNMPFPIHPLRGYYADDKRALVQSEVSAVTPDFMLVDYKKFKPFQFDELIKSPILSAIDLALSAKKII